jgi:Na+:H+ antiporter, NhaA family
MRGDRDIERSGGAPPEAWTRAREVARTAIAPIERFLRIEEASGIALIGASALALAWANSPWAAAYARLWDLEIGFSIGAWTTRPSLHELINEGLMTLFFFVVGLEIRREIHHGELSRWRSAVLPGIAAVGGMLAPALIFLLLNPSNESARAWGVPMATDIAFAVGVLALLGKRIPPALRVLLLALAIIDDVGAILVIAVFFSKGLALAGIVLIVIALAAIIFLQRLGVRHALGYVAPCFVLWLGLLKAGIHPTIAGVAAGLLTPAEPWFGPDGLAKVARHVADAVEHEGHRTERHPAAVHGELRKLAVARRETLAPVTRLQVLLHPWVSFVVMPVFAFANAGISLRDLHLDAEQHAPLMLGIILGLVVGKPAGIVLASFVAVKSKLAVLPTAVSWSGMLVVGLVGGIGFTMAIFMAGLALPSPELLTAAKLAVLIASASAAVIALVIGKTVLRQARDACTAAEAEASSVA